MRTDHAARLIGMQYRDEVLGTLGRRADDVSPSAFAHVLAALLAAQGEQVSVSAGVSAASVHMKGWKDWRARYRCRRRRCRTSPRRTAARSSGPALGRAASTRFFYVATGAASKKKPALQPVFSSLRPRVSSVCGAATMR